MPLALDPCCQNSPPFQTFAKSRLGRSHKGVAIGGANCANLTSREWYEMRMPQPSAKAPASILMCSALSDVFRQDNDVSCSVHRCSSPFRITLAVLSLAFSLSGNTIIVPMVAHAVYDFAAVQVLAWSVGAWVGTLGGWMRLGMFGWWLHGVILSCLSHP